MKDPADLEQGVSVAESLHPHGEEFLESRRNPSRLFCKLSTDNPTARGITTLSEIFDRTAPIRPQDLCARYVEAYGKRVDLSGACDGCGGSRISNPDCPNYVSYSP